MEVKNFGLGGRIYAVAILLMSPFLPYPRVLRYLLGGAVQKKGWGKEKKYEETVTSIMTIDV